jgi:small GTP-binding protein
VFQKSKVTASIIAATLSARPHRLAYLVLDAPCAQVYFRYMSHKAADRIRNVALIGHRGSGKTSLHEAMLYEAGAIGRLGSVEAGSTVSDHEPDEQRRGLSINACVSCFGHADREINLIDTPGDPSFVADAAAALRAADSAVVVVNAVAGVEVQTERLWQRADEEGLARLVFVNMLDRERADFDAALDSLKAAFGPHVVATEIPIGAEHEVRGVVDLIDMEAFVYAGAERGSAERVPIPNELLPRAEEYREKLMDEVAENSDELMERYLEGEEIAHEEIVTALKRGVTEGHLFPATCGVATKNLGTNRLLDALVEDLPSPQMRGPLVRPLDLPAPVMAFSYEAKTKGDEDKAATAVRRLGEEDPTLDVHRDPQTGEQIIAGLTQVHVEVLVERMRERFGAEIELHPPRVPYQETIRQPAAARARYKKQTGGKGQFADCAIEIEPGEDGGGLEFVNEIKGAAIPGGFIPAVEKGVAEAMQHGTVAGYPVKDVRVRLVDGKHHDTDSSELAFKLAGAMAFEEAMAEAEPALLEPIVKLTINCPDEVVGDVIGDLNSRRGRPLGMEAKGSLTEVRAEVPMTEVLDFAPDLRSISGGRAEFTMEFERYEEVPSHLAEKVVAAARDGAAVSG